MAAARVDTHRPFRGAFAGTTEFTGPCTEPGTIRIQDRGAGVMTHLGASTMEQSGCLAPTETGFTSVGEGAGHFVAANGDMLRFAGVSASGDLQTGVAHATFVIRGGSGRFQAAEGELEVVTQLLPEGAWTSSVSGWISY